MWDPPASTASAPEAAPVRVALPELAQARPAPRGRPQRPRPVLGVAVAAAVEHLPFFNNRIILYYIYYILYLEAWRSVFL